MYVYTAAACVEFIVKYTGYNVVPNMLGWLRCVLRGVTGASWARRIWVSIERSVWWVA